MTRKRIMDEILKILKEANGKIKFGELYGHFVTDVTRKTFWKYLEDLKIAGRVDYTRLVISGITEEEDIEIKLKEE